MMKERCSCNVRYCQVHVTNGGYSFVESMELLIAVAHVFAVLSFMCWVARGKNVTAIPAIISMLFLLQGPLILRDALLGERYRWSLAQSGYAIRTRYNMFARYSPHTRWQYLV